MNDKIISSIDSISKEPVNELIGARCCMLENDELRLFISIREVWSISFAQYGYNRGYLRIHKVYEGEKKHKPSKQMYWVYFNKAIVNEFKKIALKMVNQLENGSEALVYTGKDSKE